MSDQSRAIFRRYVSNVLANNPEWLRDAMEAISEGMRGALDKANEARAAYDLAMRTALILAGDKRITAEAKQVLNGAIIRAIKPEFASPAEKEMLKRLEAENVGSVPSMPDGN